MTLSVLSVDAKAEVSPPSSAQNTCPRAHFVVVLANPCYRPPQNEAFLVTNQTLNPNPKRMISRTWSIHQGLLERMSKIECRLVFYHDHLFSMYFQIQRSGRAYRPALIWCLGDSTALARPPEVHDVLGVKL